MKSAAAVMPVLRVLALMAITVSAGCVSWTHDDTQPPKIEIRVIDADPATGAGTVVVTNLSRKRILILTNRLALQATTDIKYVARPTYDPEEGRMEWSHDLRLAPGEAFEYMKLRDMDQSSRDVPAIYACWDNRHWTCEKYWLLPAQTSWQDMIRATSPGR